MSSIAQKLSALGLMTQHLGMQVETRQPVVDEELYVVGAMVVIMSPHSTNYQRTACAMLLDCLIPWWRDHLSLAAVGAISDRGDIAVRRWRCAVLERDGYCCAECGDEGQLEAHHIIRWADSPFLRVEPDNGITLCKACHVALHKGGRNLAAFH